MDHIRDRGRGLLGHAPALSFLCHGLVSSENGSKRFTYKYILPSHTTCWTIQFSTVKPAKNFSILRVFQAYFLKRFAPAPFRIFPHLSTQYEINRQSPSPHPIAQIQHWKPAFSCYAIWPCLKITTIPLQSPTIQLIFITFMTAMFLCIPSKSHHISVSQFTSN